MIEGGKFGARWASICEAYGVKAHKVSVDWGAWPPSKRPSRRFAHPKAKAIFMTHSETSTGALFPVHEIARAAKARGC